MIKKIATLRTVARNEKGEVYPKRRVSREIKTEKRERRRHYTYGIPILKKSYYNRAVSTLIAKIS